MKHLHQPLAAFAALAFLTLALGPLACSSGGGSGDSADGGSGATFTAVYTTVFSAGGSSACTSHHSGGTSAAGNLDMSTQKLAYTNLVGVPAEGSACGPAGIDGGSPEIRVVAGNSAASLLYQKLVGTPPPPCGAAMPDFGDPIPASELALVKAWIDDGAPNN